MPSILFTTLSFVVALAILIAVHEFGHFWVARRLGVKVLRFSIGFGKPLWRRTAGPDATEYVLAAIPLGGYVKMLDEREGEVAAEELPRAFNRQPVGVRAAIVVAGPLFNFIFAIFAYWLVFISGITGMKPIVGEVLAGSPAALAGLRSGEEILSVAGRSTPTWDNAVLALVDVGLEGGVVSLEVASGGGAPRVRELDLSTAGDLTAGGKALERIGIVPFQPRLPAVIDTVTPGSPAERAGLKAGDRLLRADGEAVMGWGEWVAYVRARPEVPIALEVARAGRDESLHLTPERVVEKGEGVGRIGASVKIPEGWGSEWRTEVKLGPLEALQRAAAKTAEMSLLTLRVMGKMVTGQASLENISGPITIARFVGHSASAGGVYFLSVLAVVSLSLGVLNLLPIPVLDGGHLMYYLIELLRGRPLSDVAQERGQRVGIALLLALMSLAFYNDLARLVG